MLGLEDLIVANLFVRRGAVEVETFRALLRQADQLPDRVPLVRLLHERLGVPMDEARGLHESARRRLRQRSEERYLALARREPSLAGAPLDALAAEQAQALHAWMVGDRLVRDGLLPAALHQRLQEETARQLQEDEARIVQLNRTGDYAQALARGGTQAHGGATSLAAPRVASPSLGSSQGDARLFASASSQDARSSLSPGPPPPSSADPLRATAARRVATLPPDAPQGPSSDRSLAREMRATAARRAAVLPPEPPADAVKADGERTVTLPGSGANGPADLDAPVQGGATLMLPPGIASGTQPISAAALGLAPIDGDETAAIPPPRRSAPAAQPAAGGFDGDKTAALPSPPRQNAGPSPGDGDRTVSIPPPPKPGAPQVSGSGPRPSLTAFAGRRVDGKYEIVRELGRGNMGIVFLATELANGRQVALKVVQGPANADARGRFKREILVSQRVQHPHVIEVFDAGELENKSSYMVMELLDGGSLTDLVKKVGAIERDRALALFEQLLRALEAVHAAKVVHRDLKPDNVHVLAREGRDHVKLVDFGISRFLDQAVVEQQEVFVTVRGTLSGTPQYVAPEAVLDPEKVTPTHDVYAAGVILFEMLTGTLPFPPARTLKDILADTLNTRPRALDEANPAGAPFPQALERFVRKLLEKDPEARPGDATRALEMLAEVREELMGGSGARKGPKRTRRVGAEASEGFTARFLRKITSIFRRDS